ncbi:MAG: hypothetical protein RRA32_08900, partial [bacterium]|nr:hypothetical protein [bacterium]
VFAVRGTEFAVFAEPGGRTTVSVLEGEVEVTNLDGGHSVMVAASQGSSISTGADPAPVSEIDPDAVRKLFDLLLY